MRQDLVKHNSLRAILNPALNRDTNSGTNRHTESLTKSLVLATHNLGKVEEFAALLAPLGLGAIAAPDLGLPEPVEDEQDFAGNARLKALAAARATGQAALGDDSGLSVAALGGAPGLLSARWAERQDATGKTLRDFHYAMEQVEAALRKVGVEPEGAQAQFVCALCLALPDTQAHNQTPSQAATEADGHAVIFTGTVEGKLTFPPRGTRGFGYDPIFIPEGDLRTFGEMPRLEKESQSHRARAFAQLVAWLQDPTEGTTENTTEGTTEGTTEDTTKNATENPTEETACAKPV